MGRRTKRHKNPESCAGYLSASYITMDVLRELLGMSIKYILPQEHWGFQGQVNIRTYKGISFDLKPQVRPMVNAFTSRAKEDMQDTKLVLNRCLRWLAQYDETLAKPNCKTRVRKKRISRLASGFKKRLRDISPYQKDAAQGVVIFTISVKRQFLGKA